MRPHCGPAAAVGKGCTLAPRRFAFPIPCRHPAGQLCDPSLGAAAAAHRHAGHTGGPSGAHLKCTILLQLPGKLHSLLKPADANCAAKPAEVPRPGPEAAPGHRSMASSVREGRWGSTWSGGAACRFSLACSRAALTTARPACCAVAKRSPDPPAHGNTSGWPRVRLTTTDGNRALRRALDARHISSVGR